MKNNFCKHIAAPFEMSPAVLDSLQAQYSRFDTNMMFWLKFADMDSNFVKFLAQCRMMVHHAEAFYIAPGQSLVIHIDGPTISNCCKLNWVYGGQGSKMQWWAQKDPGRQLETKRTPTGTRYVQFDREECKMIWSDSIGCPSLVNVGVPHSVDNSMSSEPRWCLSYMLSDSETDKKLEWADAADRLKDYWI